METKPVRITEKGGFGTAGASPDDAASLVNLAVQQWFNDFANHGIITTDRDLIVRSWNRWTEISAGLAAEKAVGRGLLDLFPEIAVRRLDAMYRRALAGEVVILSNRLHGHLLPMPAKETGAPYGRMQQSARIAPLAVKGKIVGTITIIEDVTERVLREMDLAHQNAVLAESESRLRRLVDNNIAPIAFWNFDGTPLYVNDAFVRMVGYSREELLSGRVTSHVLTPPEYHASDARAGQELKNTGLLPPIRKEYVRPDGTRLPLLIGATLMPKYKGEEDMVACFYMDLTEIQRAENEIRTLNAELENRVLERTHQLMASNKELEAFCYSVSHDLRAPLRGIEGFSHILLEDYHDKLDKQGREYFQRIRTATTRMSDLIDDLLNLSRLTRSGMKSEHVDLSRIAEDILAEQKANDPSRGIACEVTPGMTVTGDERLLRIVLGNLLGNAWKFTGKRLDARIAFGREERDGKTVYFIRDNGVGFDMAYVNKLFVAFQRLHGVNDFPGTGIGLAIVQRIVQRHGGRAWAEGRPGEGATFYFTIRSEDPPRGA